MNVIPQAKPPFSPRWKSVLENLIGAAWRFLAIDVGSTYIWLKPLGTLPVMRLLCDKPLVARVPACRLDRCRGQMGHGYDRQDHCDRSCDGELGWAGLLTASVWAMGRFVDIEEVSVEGVASDDADGRRAASALAVALCAGG